MNMTDRTRALTIVTFLLLTVAVVAFAGTMVNGSIRWLAAACLAATLTVVVFLWRTTARYATLIAFWQIDNDAVRHQTPRPDVVDPYDAVAQEPQAPPSPTETPVQPPRARQG